MSSSHSFYSNCGCLHSEETAILKKFTVNSPQDLHSNDKSYSQTCLQNVSNTDSLKTIFLSKESIHVEKLNTLRKRILFSLNGIQGLLGDRPQPDGVEDLKRRQQRAAEFSSRFCRYYLYPLQRQMNTIAKIGKNLQTNHTHSTFFTLCQKVIATHQNAHSALKAYLHHIPSSVEKGIPDKLEELLQVVHNLCSICTMLGMSEEDSDFNSQRVKQQCQMLMMLVKTEVSDEEVGESCTALSHTCSQKETASNSKKGSITHRFSMYSSNILLKSNSHQNKKAARISITSKKKSSKLHPNKHILKEDNITTDSKGNHLTKGPAHKPHEKCSEDDPEMGEVCANDDVKTMMEFLISEEVPTKCNVPLKRINSKKYALSFQKELERMNSKKTAPLFQKELDKQPPATPSMSTLRKLESEIKTLKKQAKYLKEIGHPNYPIYLEALEVMSSQLTGMKKRLLHPREQCREVSNTSQNLHKSDQIEITKEAISSLSKCEFPKNVKLICLSRMSDDESAHEVEFIENHVEYIDDVSVLQEDCYLKPDECQEMESTKNYFQGNEQNEMDWKSQETDSVHKMSKRKCISKLLSGFTKTHSDQNTHNLHESDQLHHNSIITENKELNFSKSANNEKGVKLTLSQSEISSLIAYQQAFQEFMSSSSLYEKSIRPWLMVGRLANNLMDNLLKEITMNDTGIQKITSGLLQLEFE